MAWLHTDRAPGGDLDHRHPDRALDPGGRKRRARRRADPVRQQPEAARAGGGRLRVGERLLAARLPAADRPCRSTARRIQRVRPPASLLDQQRPAIANNFHLTYYDAQNNTVATTQSPRSGARATTASRRHWWLDDRAGRAPATRPSRARGSGTSSISLPGFDQLIPGEAQRIAQLGLIYPLSSVRLAEVTDGLSNTLLFGETAYTTWDWQRAWATATTRSSAPWRRRT